MNSSDVITIEGEVPEKNLDDIVPAKYDDAAYIAHRYVLELFIVLELKNTIRYADTFDSFAVLKYFGHISALMKHTIIYYITANDFETGSKLPQLKDKIKILIHEYNSPSSYDSVDRIFEILNDSILLPDMPHLKYNNLISSLSDHFLPSFVQYTFIDIAADIKEKCKMFIRKDSGYISDFATDYLYGIIVRVFALNILINCNMFKMYIIESDNLSSIPIIKAEYDAIMEPFKTMPSICGQDELFSMRVKNALYELIPEFVELNPHICDLHENYKDAIDYFVDNVFPIYLLVKLMQYYMVKYWTDNAIMSNVRQQSKIISMDKESYNTNNKDKDSGYLILLVIILIVIIISIVAAVYYVRSTNSNNTLQSV